MILQPQAAFTVVRQIANHQDTDTNYVQAVIRNAYTDTTIDTLQLTDKGSQRFKKDWQVPADPSGQGFYISIVTSVYTDSGYTTKNANYGDEENTYLVQERVLRGQGGGGGVDAYTVRKIVKEELDKLPKPEPIKFPEQKEPVDRTDEIIQAIKQNKPEAAEKVDLEPIAAGIAEVKQAIAEKEVTPATDLAPLVERMQHESEANGMDFQEVKDSLVAFEERIVETVKATIKKAMDETEFTSTFSTRAQPKAAQKQETSPMDVSKLAL